MNRFLWPCGFMGFFGRHYHVFKLIMFHLFKDTDISSCHVRFEFVFLDQRCRILTISPVP